MFGAVRGTCTARFAKPVVANCRTAAGFGLRAGIRSDNINIKAAPVAQLLTSSSATLNSRTVSRNLATETSGASQVVTIETRQEFDEAVSTAGDKVVVSYFTASWCGPCKFISPKYDELSIEYSSKALFLKVDVDDNEATAMEHGIRAMPTFIFMDSSGNKSTEIVGADEAKLRAALADLA